MEHLKKSNQELRGKRVNLNVGLCFWIRESDTRVLEQDCLPIGFKHAPPKLKQNIV